MSTMAIVRWGGNGKLSYYMLLATAIIF